MKDKALKRGLGHNLTAERMEYTEKSRAESSGKRHVSRESGED